MKEALLPLDRQLVEHPYEFNFFQAVRLLGLILPDRADVGESSSPEAESVRFKVRQSLEFQASSIHALDAETDPPEMLVAFFGLTGVQGVLPHHYTEHIIARELMRDHSMAAFLDQFNHRLLSLFYRAWEKHRLPILYQNAASRAHRPDRITEYLFDMIGMGTEGLRGRLPMRDEGLLRYAGLFAQTPRSASALRGLLSDYFGIPVEIEEYCGQWHLLADDECSNLDDADLRNELGVGAIAGDTVWDPQSCFRIRLGPLAMPRFLDFLPGGAAVSELVELVRLFIGAVLRFDWQVVLRAVEVPWCQLGDESAPGARLGWCAWLKTEEFVCDADDVVSAGD